MEKFKKGDRVKVWSLQSFHGGGFLNGEEAVVRQTQNGDSVILAVVRKKDGIYTVDKSYEVYARQCEPFDYVPKTRSEYEQAKKDLEDYRTELMNNEFIR